MTDKIANFISNLEPHETEKAAEEALNFLTQESAFQLVMQWLVQNGLLEEAAEWIKNNEKA